MKIKSTWLLLFFFLFCGFYSASIVAQTEPQTKIIEVPAEYQAVTKKKLIKKSGFTDWVEVVCENQELQSDILKMKIVLKDLGYDVDTLQSRDIIDTKTRKALTQFQKDYGAPICGVGETLRFLFQTHKEHLENQ